MPNRTLELSLMAGRTGCRELPYFDAAPHKKKLQKIQLKTNFTAELHFTLRNDASYARSHGIYFRQATTLLLPNLPTHSSFFPFQY